MQAVQLDGATAVVAAGNHLLMVSFTLQFHWEPLNLARNLPLSAAAPYQPAEGHQIFRGMMPTDKLGLGLGNEGIRFLDKCNSGVNICPIRDFMSLSDLKTIKEK